MSTSTELALPTAITKKIQPRPTKTEMIEALARRKLTQIHEESEAAKRKAREIESEIHVMIRAYALENHKKLIEAADRCQIGMGNTYGNNDTIVGVHLTLQLTVCPPDIAKKRRELEKAKASIVYNAPSLSEVRRRVRCALDGIVQPAGNRVDNMLKDTGVTAALDKMLKQLDGTAAKATSV